MSWIVKVGDRYVGSAGIHSPLQGGAYRFRGKQRAKEYIRTSEPGGRVVRLWSRTSLNAGIVASALSCVNFSIMTEDTAMSYGAINCAARILDLC